MVALWYLVTRLYSFMRYGQVAFGYDTGIYRHIINGYFERFFDPTVVPFAFTGYSNSLRFLGASTDSIIFGGYIFLSLLLAGLFYFVVLEYANQKKSAWFATALLALSIVQYEFFWGYYYRNYLAIFFTFMVFYLIKIRSRLLFLPLTTLTIVHPLTALPVAISLCIYGVIKKEDRKFILISGTIAALLALFLSGREFLVYLPFITKYFGTSFAAVAAGNTEVTGLFMSGKSFLYAILWYAPLAIFALATISWKKYLLPIIFLGVNILLVLVRTVFYQRFLVSIDLILIMFAGIGLSAVWEWSRKEIKVVVIIFFIIFAGCSGNYIVHKKPLLALSEISVITKLKVEENARILIINPYYAPWLYGFTNQGIIAPGMFEYDRWNREKWSMFRGQADIQTQTEMLKEYQTQPLYIFAGERDIYFTEQLKQNKNMRKINDYIWQVL